jgi:hypothetical protein
MKEGTTMQTATQHATATPAERTITATMQVVPRTLTAAKADAARHRSRPSAPPAT